MCKKWKQGVKQSLARRETLSFAGWKMDDDSTARLVRHAYNLKELDMYTTLLSLLISDTFPFSKLCPFCVLDLL